MKAAYNLAARKRPVSLTLNEDLVAQVQSVVGNLSEVVGSLLAEFLAAENQRRAAEARAVDATAETWNRFAESMARSPISTRRCECRKLMSIVRLLAPGERTRI